MFILSNCNKKVPFKISKNNNLNVIESQVDNIKLFSIESNSPVQFFCIKHKEDGVFSKSDFIPATHFTVEKIYEKENIQKPEESNLYNNLISDFGDKKAKEKNAKKGLVSYAPKESITFNIDNQLIPPFDKDASSPRTAYSLDYMFDQELISKFENVELDPEDLTEYVRSIYDDSQPKAMAMLDCLYRVFSEKIVNEYSFSKYKFFYQSIKSDLIRGRLPVLLRDKLLVKFYVILLIFSGFEIKFSELPKFFLTKEKIVSFLKMVGCTIGKNDIVKLEHMPKDTFSTKRQKRQ